jgi:fructokinase
VTAPLHIGIELGGTKVVVAGSDGDGELIGRTRIDTTTPTETLHAVRRAITSIAAGRRIEAVGIATFGPVDLRPDSPAYGTIVDTPKPGWSGVNIVSELARAPGTVVAIDTDVNAALMGEVAVGAVQTPTAAYLTIGTGIGGAIWANAGLIRGANHPEIGHVMLPRRDDDAFEGSCPYHGTCLEGLASGGAFARRLGTRLEALGEPDRLEARDLAAHYVGSGIVSLVAVVPVETVVIGGGVSHLPGFHDAVASVVARVGNGYPPVPIAAGGPSIVPPGLGDDAGVVGAIELAGRALSESGG